MYACTYAHTLKHRANKRNVVGKCDTLIYDIIIITMIYNKKNVVGKCDTLIYALDDYKKYVAGDKEG